MANAFGLFDMHGNVSEWCEDLWHPFYHDKLNKPPSDGSAWLSLGGFTQRVLRGGSWYHNGGNCRSANRSRSGAGAFGDNSGFRVVLSIIGGTSE